MEVFSATDKLPYLTSWEWERVAASPASRRFSPATDDLNQSDIIAVAVDLANPNKYLIIQVLLDLNPKTPELGTHIILCDFPLCSFSSVRQAEGEHLISKRSFLTYSGGYKVKVMFISYPNPNLLLLRSHCRLSAGWRLGKMTSSQAFAKTPYFCVRPSCSRNNLQERASGSIHIIVARFKKKNV